MKKKLASVEAEKECVRGEEAKKREEKKGSFEDSRFGRKKQFARRRKTYFRPRTVADKYKIEPRDEPHQSVDLEARSKFGKEEQRY
jgi:hypothetical protein